MSPEILGDVREPELRPPTNAQAQRAPLTETVRRRESHGKIESWRTGLRTGGSSLGTPVREDMLRKTALDQLSLAKHLVFCPPRFAQWWPFATKDGGRLGCTTDFEPAA